MDISTFGEKIAKEAESRGFEDWEIYYENSGSTSVKIFKGEVQEYKSSNPVGVSFRGTVNGRIGYSFTERIHEDVIRDLVKNAADNAAIIDAEEIERLYRGGGAYPEAICYNPGLRDLGAREMVEFGLRMEKAAFESDGRVRGEDFCVVGSGEGETAIINSHGLNLSHKTNMINAFISVIVEEDGNAKAWGELWYGTDPAKFDPEALGAAAVKKAVSYLPAKSMPSGACPVVFNNESAADLLDTFSGIFYADSVQKGFSLLKDKTGTKIASDCVTIRDDYECEGSIVKVPFDSEGVACKNKVVIENGILKTLLYNLKSAEKDGVESTGNGFKPGLRQAVDTSCTNFHVVAPGEGSGNVYEGVGSGLYITEVSGLHAGANTVTGDFSLLSKGFLIENGELGRPVEQITVSGNFYKLLLDIESVGGDVRFSIPSGSGSVGTPSILVRELQIAGE